ncbi:hypothetical protein ACFL6O_00020 [candidate division KSB1 bacterium]
MKSLKLFITLPLIILTASSIFAQNPDNGVIKDFNILINGWITEFEVSESDPDIIFAVERQGNGYTGVYKTSNRGEDWEKVKGITQFQKMAIDPVNPEIVFGVPGG